ncbi:MAG: hypothetical protein WC655_25260 [Candidatus Hydrogenedentales bacterium]|jgi:hypothetical protein
MEFIRITSIDNPLFKSMHELMQKVFPPEEVLAFDAWRDPLEDPAIRVCVAVHDGGVVGATEYRYYADFRVAMTDFTIVGRAGLGIGRFIFVRRQSDIAQWAERQSSVPLGMFAEVYDPYRAEKHAFGGIKVMDPFVRREVLSHLGYRRLDFPYVHPSWKNNGAAVTELDLCFLPADETLQELPADVVANFLTRYYSVLPNKPAEWRTMLVQLRTQEFVPLAPL